MMKKPEITIQYFIESGRRRTLTVSLQRLNALLVAGLVFCLWSAATTAFLFYHIITGQSPFHGFGDEVAKRRSVISVLPDFPERKETMPMAVKNTAPQKPTTTVSLAAKNNEAVTETKSESTVATQSSPDLPQYTLAKLIQFESALKKTEVPGPLRFRNVRISIQDDHLRVHFDIEKLSGAFVEGHAFVAVEYENDAGRKWLITSHGQRDWDAALSPSSMAKATYFKARLLTRKRFDIVHSGNKSAKIVSLKLVAKDRKSGQIVVEEITPDVQSDVLGF